MVPSWPVGGVERRDAVALPRFHRLQDLFLGGPDAAAISRTVGERPSSWVRSSDYCH